MPTILYLRLKWLFTYIKTVSSLTVIHILQENLKPDPIADTKSHKVGNTPYTKSGYKLTMKVHRR